MYVYLFSFIIILLFLCFFAETISSNYNKVKTLCTIYKNFNDPEKLKNPTHATIEEGNIKIIYTYNNRNYQIHLPFEKERIIPMLENEVFAECKGEKINITQQAGIPYMITPAHLGCEKILVENTDSGETTVFVDKQQIKL